MVGPLCPISLSLGEGSDKARDSAEQAQADASFSTCLPSPLSPQCHPGLAPNRPETGLLIRPALSV